MSQSKRRGYGLQGGLQCAATFIFSNGWNLQEQLLGFIFWKRLQKIPSKFQRPKWTAWNHNTNVLFVRLCFSALLMSSPAARTSRRKMGRPSVLTGHLGSSRRMPLECESFASTPWLTVKSSSHVQESGHWWWKHIRRAGWKPPYLLNDFSNSMGFSWSVAS